MAIRLAWGLPGAGKGLIASVMAEKYAMLGRRIVTNYPLNLQSLSQGQGGKLWNYPVTVLPSYPSSVMLFGLGLGSDDMKKPGLIIWDESADELGSREWNNKDRAKQLQFLRLHRKLRWDILLITQDPDFLDKQVLKLCSEFGRVRNWGELYIPVVGSFFNLKFPDLHSCNFKLNRERQAPSVSLHMFKGKRYHATYETEWLFSDHAEDPAYTAIPDIEAHCKAKADISLKPPRQLTLVSLLLKLVLYGLIKLFTPGEVKRVTAPRSKLFA